MAGLSEIAVNNEEGPEFTYSAMNGPVTMLQAIIKYQFEQSRLNLESDKAVAGMLDLVTRHLVRLSDLNSRLRAIGSYGLTYAYLDGFTLEALEKNLFALDFVVEAYKDMRAVLVDLIERGNCHQKSEN